MTLTRRILLAMTLAIVLGSLTKLLLGLDWLPALLHTFLQVHLVDGLFNLGGQVFLASLKLLVVPLVFVSLVCGVCQLKDQSSLGRMTLKTLVLYLGTTGLAISMALLLATWWQPGIGIEMQADLEFQPAEPVPLFDVLLNIFPSNPFAAMEKYSAARRRVAQALPAETLNRLAFQYR